MRLAARTDANHAEVRDAFRKLGCSVVDLARVGCGCPDLLVARGGVAGYGGKMAFVEVKDGTRPPSERQLTDDQKQFIQAWRGPIYVVESLDEVLKVVGHLK